MMNKEIITSRNHNRIFRFKRNLKKVVSFCAILVCGLILLIFIFRNLFFHLYLQKKIETANQKYHIDLVVGKTRIQGLSSILLSDITLKPDHADTLVRIGSVYADFSPWWLLFRKIVLRDLDMRNTRISFIKQNGITNYQFLLEGRSKNIEGNLELQKNYASQIDRLADIIFSFFPNSMNLENLVVSGYNEGKQVGFFMDKVEIKDHSFRSQLKVREDTLHSTWILDGKLNPSDHMAGFTVFSADPRKITVPFLKFRWGADVRFDTVTFTITEEQKEDDLTGISGSASIKGLYIEHAKIAVVPLLFDKLGVDFQVNVRKDNVELDSATAVTFNKLSFHPYFSYRSKPSKQITLRIHKPEFPAGDLFSSFPQGLFSNLDGIKVKGKLSWYLDFFVDLAIPDSLRFETELRRHQFSVLSYGTSELLKINEPFLYTAYEKGVPVRTFMVGPENPDFRTIDKISPFLKLAVLGSEDAGFYQHRGFLPDSFRESIITNIKEHRFARGGSTISMQLVKNVFLNRNKTIARKLEEALLVWLIENQGLCTKDRMFEVYLNIIEWGPDIYGANEAARFYFRKDASKLTLAESIFLASIIPRPKWFKYSFDENGHLRTSAQDFLKLLSGKMLKKEQITQQEYEKFIPDVELKGASKLLLKKTGIIPADTLEEGDLGL
jgi:hypothetical protein